MVCWHRDKERPRGCIRNFETAILAGAVETGPATAYVALSLAMVASISLREMLTGEGSCGSASSVNHFASAISSSQGLISPPAYSALYAIISECGNAHDWLAK